MPATTPIAQDKDYLPQKEWLQLHDSFLARKSEGPIDLLFIGDSITQGWLGEGLPIWESEYLPMNAANFGIGGDETQHILWRLHHGEVDDISPRLVVLKVGTNNLGNSGHSADQTIAGIVKVVETLKEKLPTSKILLLGLFPRDAKPNTPHRRAISQINRTIAALDDGHRIRFLDLGSIFLQPDGRLSPQMMPDYLHLSARAYQMWADAMRPMLAEMMGQ